jgi:8-oxo-dGTP diphosphatase
MTGLRPVGWCPDHLPMSETPAPARLRRAVRAIIVAGDDRVLLCRFGFPHPAVPAGAAVVWAAPGGGVEPGELPLAALRRELHEETGLVMDASPPHVWHQEVAAPGQADGYDGVRGCDGGGTQTSPDTAEPTCSHRVTSPHRWRR